MTRPNVGLVDATANNVASDPLALGVCTVETARAELGGIATSTIYELMSGGEIAYTRVGRRRMVLRSSIRALLMRGLVGGTR
jgi:hypothetical protein